MFQLLKGFWQDLLEHHRHNDEIQAQWVNSEVSGGLSCHADWVGIGSMKPHRRSVTSSIAQGLILEPVLFNRNLMKLNERKSQVITVLTQFCSMFPLLLL